MAAEHMKMEQKGYVTQERLNAGNKAFEEATEKMNKKLKDSNGAAGNYEVKEYINDKYYVVITSIANQPTLALNPAGIGVETYYTRDVEQTIGITILSSTLNVTSKGSFTYGLNTSGQAAVNETAINCTWRATDPFTYTGQTCAASRVDESWVKHSNIGLFSYPYQMSVPFKGIIQLSMYGNGTYNIEVARFEL
ncbi:hypothetical protein [Brevibacillus dissolubilis]|uniref:hypothetical protein n=1 Tax=Brevibacillus dissolubilis TaxID=1844116 RepID=UPI0011172577|nr:hypothetical protein [Brevibacillus dissolubilis]